ILKKVIKSEEVREIVSKALSGEIPELDKIREILEIK
ncbi:unnamed protein product, partial [marine sediment metagenome]